MIQHSACLCDGKLIGIESIYTVHNGAQINIPEKLQDLRKKSREGRLTCACGCGTPMELVAGEKNLRQQHFRSKKGARSSFCKETGESEASINTKIVLKCWLDETLADPLLEARVNITPSENPGKHRELTFLSRANSLGLLYIHSRPDVIGNREHDTNHNTGKYHILYFLDELEDCEPGQYPESAMYIQDEQGFCLFLYADGNDYPTARLAVAFYAQAASGRWQRYNVITSELSAFSIIDSKLWYNNRPVSESVNEKRQDILNHIEQEKEQQRRADEARRAEMEKRERERQELAQRQREDAERQRQQMINQNHWAGNKYPKTYPPHTSLPSAKKAKKIAPEKHFPLAAITSKEPVYYQGQRLYYCPKCGWDKYEEELAVFNVDGHINVGICKECFQKPSK